MFLTQQQIDAFKAANPSVDVRAVKAKFFDGPEGIVALIKRPDRTTYRAFKKIAGDVDQMKNAVLANYEAREVLCKACIVLPEKAELEKLLDEYPGLVETVGGELAEFAGLVFTARSEKP